MTELLTAAQMRAIEAAAIASGEVTSLELMERAGRGVVEAVFTEHMRDYVATSEDNGGVHINSGIPNKAFELVATALGGHAWERAGRIWYLTVTGGTLSRRECEHADAPRASRGADRFTWEISARTPDGVRSALIDESGAAGAWRALIDAVRSGSDGGVRTR